MKQWLSFLATVLLVSACASAHDDTLEKRFDPSVEVIQLTGPASSAGFPEGPVSIQFRINVTNPSEESLRLTRIEMTTLGVGSYSMASQSLPVDLVVRPRQTASTTLWFPAVARGGYQAALSPVMLRVSAQFDSREGKFQKTFTEMIDQSSGRGTPSK